MNYSICDAVKCRCVNMDGKGGDGPLFHDKNCNGKTARQRFTEAFSRSDPIPTAPPAKRERRNETIKARFYDCITPFPIAGRGRGGGYYH